MMQGHCLNGLLETKFELSSSNMKSPSASIPKAVKRVHEIFEEPTFLKTVSGCDVKQGLLGDCWFMASLTALAGTDDAIKRTCVEYDTREFAQVAVVGRR
jgi:calpain family cysteine protease